MIANGSSANASSVVGMQAFDCGSARCGSGTCETERAKFGCAAILAPTKKAGSMRCPSCVPCCNMTETAATGQQLNDTSMSLEPIFIEHVMKAGGTVLCTSINAVRGCVTSHSRNCRLDQLAPGWHRVTGGRGVTDPWLNRSVTTAAMLDNPRLCGIVAHEPAVEHTRSFLLATSLPHVHQPFWSAFTTILLVRSPWARFISHVEMLVEQHFRGNGHYLYDLYGGYLYSAVLRWGANEHRLQQQHGAAGGGNGSGNDTRLPLSTTHGDGRGLSAIARPSSGGGRGRELSASNGWSARSERPLNFTEGMQLCRTRLPAIVRLRANFLAQHLLPDSAKRVLGEEHGGLEKGCAGGDDDPTLSAGMSVIERFTLVLNPTDWPNRTAAVLWHALGVRLPVRRSSERTTSSARSSTTVVRADVQERLLRLREGPEAEVVRAFDDQNQCDNQFVRRANERLAGHAALHPGSKRM